MKKKWRNSTACHIVNAHSNAKERSQSFHSRKCLVWHWPHTDANGCRNVSGCEATAPSKWITAARKQLRLRCRAPNCNVQSKLKCPTEWQLRLVHTVMWNDHKCICNATARTAPSTLSNEYRLLFGFIRFKYLLLEHLCSCVRWTALGQNGKWRRLDWGLSVCTMHTFRWKLHICETKRHLIIEIWWKTKSIGFTGTKDFMCWSGARFLHPRSSSTFWIEFKFDAQTLKTFHFFCCSSFRSPSSNPFSKIHFCLLFFLLLWKFIAYTKARRPKRNVNKI